MLIYNPEYKLFIWRGPFESRHLPRDAKFEWSSTGKRWFTANPFIACKLYRYAVNGAAQALAPLHHNILAGMRKEPVLGVDERLYPFQNAGVETIVERMHRGRMQQLLSDEQGLGKTPQAICVANAMGFEKLLVICPASIRLNWKREIDKWHTHNPGAQALLSGSQTIDPGQSLITSYALAGYTDKYKPDFIIIDECHALKSAAARRTRTVLGDNEGWPGLVNNTPTLFLSGTPEPNGRPSELYSILKRTAPEAISNMGFMAFARTFCNLVEDDYGSTIVKGARNRRELYIRLRGSGFMTRRLKKDVLTELPPKQYKMVVFPVTGATAKVLKKEQPFDAREIKRHGGAPPDSGLAEIRHEMGIAKVPQSVDYITDLLAGVDKVVVFCHHVAVAGELMHALGEFNPVCIVGATPAGQRQKNVDAFQTDPEVRVFIGNEAAEEGWTLTAAQDVVLVEPNWVPGKDAQRVDRLHRIGQVGTVTAHILVVEDSLDIKILGEAADKSDDIKNTLDEA